MGELNAETIFVGEQVGRLGLIVGRSLGRGDVVVPLEETGRILGDGSFRDRLGLCSAPCRIDSSWRCTWEVEVDRLGEEAIGMSVSTRITR